MLNFTALWSPYAKWNLKHAIDTPAVLTAVEQNDAVPMVADWTDQAPEVKAKFNSLKCNSIPVLAIYPADRPNDPIVLPDIVSQSQVLEALNCAGPSHKMIARTEPEFFRFFGGEAR